MSDKVYLTEMNTISDSKVVARCSVCSKVVEAKGSELNSVKIHVDAHCLYCDECFKNLFKHRHNQKLYREPF